MKSAIYICTHGRPSKQITHRMLRKAGYTGEIVLVIDNEDEHGKGYLEFVKGEDNTRIHVFDKRKIIDSTNTTNYPPNRKTILYAKNACEQFAKEDNCDCFVICDDDIPGFRYRYVEGKSCKSLTISDNMDQIIDSHYKFLIESNVAATSFGIAQFYFTGANCFNNDNMQKWRIPYTFVFRNIQHSIDWVSDYGEDITTSIEQSRHGQFQCAMPFVQMNLSPMGVGDGGMVELHKDTFRLAEYGHVWHPDCEQIKYYKDHWMSTIERDKAFPKLISSSFKKI